MLTAIAQTKTSAKVFGQPGYSTDIELTAAELEMFEGYVTAQWLARIRERHPALAERFAQAGMRNYHLLADQVDHAGLWPKRFRVFPREWVERIKASPVMARLREAFGDFSISDVVFSDAVEVGREEVYWRLVRPHAQGDVGPLHADKWFHESLSSEYGMSSPDVTSAKIWLPIFCEPGLNGLIVVPGSHQREWRYRKIVESNGHVTPQLDEDIDPKACVLVPTNPGTLVIFNERLLHRGAVNLGNFVRVSIEITMVFR